MLDGTVIAQNMQRHRHQEFIRFLNRIEREVPTDKAVHVILDNYAAHKKDKVRDWLARHPRWTFHFTPTSCSWLNAVEGFFERTDVEGILPLHHAMVRAGTEYRFSVVSGDRAFVEVTAEACAYP